MGFERSLVLIRGGGDLASGVALRLHHGGFPVIITEIQQPLAVRRPVSFAEAIYSGEVQIEGVHGRHVHDASDIAQAVKSSFIPVLIDPHAKICELIAPEVIVDGRMLKQAPDIGVDAAELVIGLGPGFTAGEDCHAVVETRRGPNMGRVIWEGSAETDTGLPEPVHGYDSERVLRSPADGELKGGLEIGTLVEAGDELAIVGSQPVVAPFDGVLRGLMHDGLQVRAGMKIGDLDPRGIPEYCFRVSDKSLAVGGAVLEATLSRSNLRPMLGE